MPTSPSPPVIAEAMCHAPSTRLGQRRLARARGVCLALCTALVVAVGPGALLGSAPAWGDPLAEASQARAPTEWEMRAAFLYKFISYIRWPKESLPEDKSPLVVGVLGRDPFGKALDALLNQKQHGAHPIVVQRFETAETAAKCHVLYVSTTDAEEIARIVAVLGSKPILLVGEGRTFTKHGGAIAFELEARRLVFTINTQAAKAAQLELSSQLLKLAKRIETEGEKNP